MREAERIELVGASLLILAWEKEARGSKGQGHPQLQTVLEARLEYKRSCLKKQRKKKEFWNLQIRENWSICLYVSDFT